MNILVLTSVYKDRSLGNLDGSTDVVNSFVHDWVRMGHRVIVIHNSHRYPIFIHYLPRALKKKLASRLGFGIADYKAICEKKYEDSGAQVWRLPMLKLIPHKSPARNAIQKRVEKIKAILKKTDFKPDVITGHWASPQMEIISELKKQYQCCTAVVLHGNGYVSSSSFPVKEYLKYIDKLGCRSATQAKQIKELLQLEEMPFVCYSGVPDAYLQNFKLDTTKFINIKTWKFIYIGRLVQYKHVETIIKALATFSDIDWKLDIVGDGAEEGNLKQTARECNCIERVTFHGRVPRDTVMELLKESHCFVLVSKGEVFGLVYLEAMAASCVAIGSIGEGIDGVIVDGQNGLLCEPADVQALRKKLQVLFSMDTNGTCELVTNGYKTAEEFADSKVAEKYMKSVFS